MPCFKSSTNGGATGVGPPSGGGFTTEADCLNACKEGACCESNGTCSVKPQCQCQETGQTFRGVGTTCTPNPCCNTRQTISLEIKNTSVDESNWCQFPGLFSAIENAYTLTRTGNDPCGFEYSYYENVNGTGLFIDAFSPEGSTISARVRFQILGGAFGNTCAGGFNGIFNFGITLTKPTGLELWPRLAAGNIPPTGVSVAVFVQQFQGFGSRNIGTADVVLSEANPLP